MKSKVYLAVTIDTECDKGLKWKVKQPLSFKAITESVPFFFQPLFNRLGVKATYLLSPEVMRHEKCVEVLSNTLKEGAELGTHLHSEFIEPQMSLDAEFTNIRQNSLNPELEFLKLKNLTDLFISKFHFAPKSFRAGRFSISNHTLGFLDKLGYEVDSSVVPNKYVIEKDGAVGHNFIGSPRHPYYPSENNPIQPGDLNILQIPVSTNYNIVDRLPKFLRKRWHLQNKWVYAIKYFFKENTKTVILRPSGNRLNLEEQYRIIEDNIGRRESVYFVMMFHNVDFIPGCSPYAKTAADQEKYVQNLTKIVDKIKSYNGEFVTLSEMTKIYKSENK